MNLLLYSGCSGTYTLESGENHTIHSPGYTEEENYPSDSECVHTFIAPKDHILV